VFIVENLVSWKRAADKTGVARDDIVDKALAAE